MSGSCNETDLSDWTPDEKRMRHLFRSLRAEVLSKAPSEVRDAVVRIVKSIDDDCSPVSSDLAIALMWTLDRRSDEIRRKRKKKRSPEKKASDPVKSRWVDMKTQDRDTSLPKPKRAPKIQKKTKDKKFTAFGLRLEEQEDDRSGISARVREMRRRLGGASSRTATDAFGRRIKISGD